MTRHPRGACPTGKRRFRSRAHAERTLSSIWAHVKPGRRLESRAYKCRECKQWHLTSQPAREGAST